jgi:hypothetical protein
MDGTSLSWVWSLTCANASPSGAEQLYPAGDTCAHCACRMPDCARWMPAGCPLDARWMPVGGRACPLVTACERLCPSVRGLRRPLGPRGPPFARDRPGGPLSASEPLGRPLNAVSGAPAAGLRARPAVAPLTAAAPERASLRTDFDGPRSAVSEPCRWTPLPSCVRVATRTCTLCCVSVTCCVPTTGRRGGRSTYPGPDHRAVHCRVLCLGGWPLRLRRHPVLHVHHGVRDEAAHRVVPDQVPQARS